MLQNAGRPTVTTETGSVEARSIGGLYMSEGPGPPSQERIWSHFQNQQLEAFEGAAPRLDFLAKQATKRVRTPRRKAATVGVGDGHLERQLATQGWEVIVVDPNAEALSRLAIDGVEGRQGVMESLPIDDNAVDVVIASEVLEHLDEDQGRLAVIETARILRPAGWFLGTVPYAEDIPAYRVACPRCGEVFHRWGHQRSFDRESMRAELSQAFASVEVQTRAFLDFRRRSLGGFGKSALRWTLGRIGSQLAVPNIYFAATEPRPR